MAKIRFTVDNPPRIYEVAIFLGMDTQRVLNQLRNLYGIRAFSASSKCPLPIAIKYVDMCCAKKAQFPRRNFTR
jgi:hypothetical protein